MSKVQIYTNLPQPMFSLGTVEVRPYLVQMLDE